MIVFLGIIDVETWTPPKWSVTLTRTAVGGGRTVGKYVIVGAVIRGEYVLVPISDSAICPGVGSGDEVSNRYGGVLNEGVGRRILGRVETIVADSDERMLVMF